MQKMNKSWNVPLLIALGFLLAALSLPSYSEESSAQAAPADTTEEGTGQSSGATTAESPSGGIETSAQEQQEGTGHTPPMAEPSEDAVKKPPQSEHVVRALLTTGIENREPVDEIVSLNKNQERIYFFTEFTGLKGQMIKHRWEYNGKVMGEVNFNVGSNRWRCYSSKNLLPEWTGIWTVSVIDEKNNVLSEAYFEVTE